MRQRSLMLILCFFVAHACGGRAVGSAERLNKSGISKQGIGDWDGAISDYTKAIEINPRYSEAYANRGVAYEVRKDLDKALADYGKAIEFDPSVKKVFNDRGYIRQQKGDLDGAIGSRQTGALTVGSHSFDSQVPPHSLAKP